MIVNPVLAKELRDRVRTWRSPLMITMYLGVLAGVSGLYFYLETRYNYGGTQALRLGVNIFTILSILQLGLIAVLTPGMTAAIISGERERQTLPLLQVTRLSSFSIVIGKLLSAISYIVFLILISMPIYSLAFLFGGVAMKELLLVILITLVTTVTLAAIGLFCSALFKRTTTAIIISYLITLFIFVGTLISAELFKLLTRESWIGKNPPIPFIVNFSPLVAFGSAFPFGRQFVPYASRDLVNQIPAWQINFLLDALIMAVALGLTVWFIHPLRAGNKKGG